MRLTDNVVDTLLRLTAKGFTVGFSRETCYHPARVIRIELCKGDQHHMQLVDIDMVKDVDAHLNRYLEKSEWEFMYAFEKESLK